MLALVKRKAGSLPVIILGTMLALAGSYLLRRFGFSLYDSIGTYPGDIWYIHWNYGELLQKPIFFNIEYPAGSFLFFKAATLLTLMISPGFSYESFLMVNSVLLGMFAVGSTVLIHRIHRLVNPEPDRTWKVWVFWIFAPSFIFYSLMNYDLPAVFLTMLAVYLHLRQSDDLSALALGLGVAAKIYPLFLLPLFLLNKKPAEALRYCLVSGGIWLMVNLSFMLTDFRAWLFPYLWQTTREPTIDGPVYALYHLFGSIPASLFLPVLYFVTLAAIAWRRRLNLSSPTLDERGVVVGFSAALLLTFLLANRIFSPQYILWILPFLVLMPAINLAPFYIFETLNVAITLLLFGVMTDYPTLTVVLRSIKYLALVWLFVQALFAWQPEKERALLPAAAFKRLRNALR